MSLACSIRLDEDAARTARDADLYFSTDCTPGIRRSAGDAGDFLYSCDEGTPLSAEDLQRIRRLRIPPAWTDVWICSDERGHLQATGRDAKGRKQYRYHERWQSVRDASKYERLVPFGEALPRIRERVDSDLRHPQLDKERVLALVVAVLDRTYFRVGNPQYARENDSFGLTTLRATHADIRSTRVMLRFRGKAGRELAFDIDDPRIVRAFRRIQEIPGQELFQYLDSDGMVRIIESGDVNEYLREAGGSEITSKDFRTWGGSLAAALVLAAEAKHPPSERGVTRAIRRASEVLNNTPAVCRRSYVHPGLLDLYRSGEFAQAWMQASRRTRGSSRLSQEERVFLALLKRMETLPAAQRL